MTTTLDRPDEAPVARPEARGRRGRPPPGRGSGEQRGDRRSASAGDSTADLVTEVAAALLVMAAALPLSQVFSTAAWVRPTLGAILVTMGVAAAARRAGVRAPTVSALAAGALAIYVSVVFVPTTTWLGVVPTPGTAVALVQQVVEGLSLMPQRVAPTPVVPALALLAVGGTGVIALLVDLLVHAGRAPLKGAVVALTLWVVPLSMAPPSAARPLMTVPVLAALALLLSGAAGTDLARWGRWFYPRERSHIQRSAVSGGAAVVAVVAIVVGSLAAGTLPGYGERGWLDVRGNAAGTLTANPIVGMRSNLVASGDRTLLRVTAPQPVYLRTTSLDTYSDAEEWTSSTIVTQPLRSGIMAAGPFTDDAFTVDVQVGEVSGELVPVPWQPLRAVGPLADRFQLDPRTGTVALDEGVVLQEDDAYRILVQPPTASFEQLREAGERAPGDPMTALPAGVPDEVATLAEQIVTDAGATTPLEQALAIQEELRSWEYSLDPPAGHDASAMLRFLESRAGYCEQFAGTMAVMLRTLDIPARVAVGFTPGRPLRAGSDTYAVSWSNAHAWVEVRFAGIGWVTFEPTPRSDGNVLVPTAVDPSPARLARAAIPLTAGPVDPFAGFQGPQPGDDILTADMLRNRQLNPAATPATSDSGSAGARGALVALAIAVVGVVVWRRRSPAARDLDPPRRIVAAGDRARRAAFGVRRAPHDADTDREWLARLAAGTRVAPDADVLADALTRARYAPTVDVEDAARAEQASARLVDHLVGSLSPGRRLRARLRGAVGERAARARVRSLRQEADALR